MIYMRHFSGKLRQPPRYRSSTTAEARLWILSSRCLIPRRTARTCRRREKTLYHSSGSLASCSLLSAVSRFLRRGVFVLIDWRCCPSGPRARRRNGVVLVRCRPRLLRGKRHCAGHGISPFAQRAIAQFDGSALKRPANEAVAAQVRARINPLARGAADAALDRWIWQAMSLVLWWLRALPRQRCRSWCA